MRRNPKLWVAINKDWNASAFSHWTFTLEITIYPSQHIHDRYVNRLFTVNISKTVQGNVSMCSFVFLCQDLHQTTQLKGIHLTTNQFLPKMKCWTANVGRLNKLQWREHHHNLCHDYIFPDDAQGDSPVQRNGAFSPSGARAAWPPPQRREALVIIVIINVIIITIAIIIRSKW